MKMLSSNKRILVCIVTVILLLVIGIVAINIYNNHKIQSALQGKWYATNNYELSFESNSTCEIFGEIYSYEILESDSEFTLIEATSSNQNSNIYTAVMFPADKNSSNLALYKEYPKFDTNELIAIFTKGNATYQISSDKYIKDISGFWTNSNDKKIQYFAINSDSTCLIQGERYTLEAYGVVKNKVWFRTIALGESPYTYILAYDESEKVVSLETKLADSVAFHNGAYSPEVNNEYSDAFNLLIGRWVNENNLINEFQLNSDGTLSLDSQKYIWRISSISEDEINIYAKMQGDEANTLSLIYYKDHTLADRQNKILLYTNLGEDSNMNENMYMYEKQ